MYRIHQIKLPVGEPKDKIPEKILKKIGGRDLFIKEWEIVKESIDARDKSNLCWVYSVDFNVASMKVNIYVASWAIQSEGFDSAESALSTFGKAHPWA